MYFSSTIWVVSKWCSVLKVWEQLEINTAKWCKTLREKSLSYSKVKYIPRVPLIPVTAKKIEYKHFDLVLLLIHLLLSFFLSSYPSSINQKVCNVYEQSAHQKQLLYFQRLLFLWLELHASYDRRVMGPNTNGRLLPICYFVHTYMHNLKTKGPMSTLYLRNDCSTTGDAFFLG